MAGRDLGGAVREVGVRGERGRGRGGGGGGKECCGGEGGGGGGGGQKSQKPAYVIYGCSLKFLER